MTARLANITFDCDDALAVARFWSGVLDRPLADEPPPSRDYACIGGDDHPVAVAPAWLFQRVPEKKTAKNRVHVDLAAPDREAEIARLEGLGATRVEDKEEGGERWTILLDPEGNEFCVAGETAPPA